MGKQSGCAARAASPVPSRGPLPCNDPRPGPYLAQQRVKRTFSGRTYSRHANSPQIGNSQVLAVTPLVLRVSFVACSGRGCGRIKGSSNAVAAPAAGLPHAAAAGLHAAAGLPYAIPRCVLLQLSCKSVKGGVAMNEAFERRWRSKRANIVLLQHRSSAAVLLPRGCAWLGVSNTSCCAVTCCQHSTSEKLRQTQTAAMAV